MKVRKLYRQKCFTRNIKLRYYNVAVEPEVLYGTETLLLTEFEIAL